MKLLQDSTLDFMPIGKTPDTSAPDVVLTPLLKHLLGLGEGHVVQFSERGTAKKVSTDKSNLRFVKKMEELGGRSLHKVISDNSYNILFVWDHGAVSIAVSNKYLQVSGVSLDGVWLAEVAKFIKGEMAPAVQHGHIFAIVRAGNGFQLSPIGDASVPLEVGNYTPAVIENYRFIIRDLSTSTPSGRIVILEGEPGTGKTHLIRALLHDVNDGMFVLVSPDMVPSLSGPDILPTLINTKTSYNIKGPIVLVLEDADRCLVRREGDNMSFIQSLLNLGDGILGSMLDLRILATTNAKKLDMEGAILRPGRLSRRMEVGPLDLETARSVFNRLLPNVQFPQQLETDSSSFGFRGGSSTAVSSKMTLAEVYGLARKHGWEPKAVEVEEMHSEYKLEELFENSYDDDDDDDE